MHFYLRRSRRIKGEPESGSRLLSIPNLQSVYLQNSVLCICHIVRLDNCRSYEMKPPNCENPPRTYRQDTGKNLQAGTLDGMELGPAISQSFSNCLDRVRGVRS